MKGAPVMNWLVAEVEVEALPLRVWGGLGGEAGMSRIVWPMYLLTVSCIRLVSILRLMPKALSRLQLFQISVCNPLPCSDSPPPPPAKHMNTSRLCL